MMTPYSVLAATAWSCVFILVLYFCRRNTKFVVQFGAGPLLLLFGGCALRCFLPLDLAPYTQVIPLKGWFAAVNAILARPLPGFSFDLYSVLGFLWLAGTLACLIRMAWVFFKARRFFTRLQETEDARVLAALERVSARMGGKRARVICSSQFTVPVIFFQTRPTILLPSISYTDRELEYVFTHELTHWKNRDPWIKLLVQLCCALFWWNPLMYLLRRDLDQTLELKCDLAVTAAMEDEEKVEYLETFLKTMRAAPARRRTSLVAAAEFTDSSDAQRMKQRFRLILDYVPDRRKERFRSAVASLLITVCLAFSFAFVVQPSYVPPPEDFTSEGGAEVHPGNAYLKETDDGDFLLYVEGEELPQRLSPRYAEIMKKAGFRIEP